MSKSVALLLVLVLLTASCLATLVSVNADYRTIVVPDDYPNITEAINNANNGDTILIREGTHKGPINQTIAINKTLSIVGENAKNTTINLYPAYNLTWLFATPYFNYTDAITITANDCRLLNLTVVIYPGGDVSVTGNQTQIIDNNITKGLTIVGSHSYIARNIIGYRFTLKNTSFNLIDSNSVSENFYMEYADLNLFANNTCHGFTIGYYGYTCSSNIVIGNIMKGDVFSHWGIDIDDSGTNNIFCGNYIGNYTKVGYGGWGVRLGIHAVNNTFYHNNLVNNKENVGDSIVLGNFWDNGREGNYWDDYNGTDSNKDGIGDTPYVINENNQDNYPLMAPFEIDSVTVELPEWASPPFIQLISPKNTTYASANVTLEFTVNKQTSWMGYSLDGQDNVTVTGNTTIAGLSNGLHNVTVYAEDTFGNVGASETLNFSVEVPEPFPTTLVAVASGASVAVIGAVLAIYFKKRHPKSGGKA